MSGGKKGCTHLKKGLHKYAIMLQMFKDFKHSNTSYILMLPVLKTLKSHTVQPCSKIATKTIKLPISPLKRDQFS